MNIAIDISPLKTGHFLMHKVRGSGFYLEHLKNSLLKYYPQNSYIFFTRGERLSKNIDVVHYPYFEPFFLTLPFIKKYKTVVTVHDLTPLVFPKHFPAGLKGKIKWNIQKRSLRKVDAIITDSESSKKDIQKYTGVSNEKIHVVYLAAGEEFKKLKLTNQQVSELKKKYNLPDKFVLYVGDATWNKNLIRLVQVIQETNIPLVMVGKALADDQEIVENVWNSDLIKISKMAKESKNITRLGFVPTEDLVLLYNLATLFIMPSLYEGFGLPVLEAMACGCPIIVSKEGSLPEVAGKAGYYVDAYQTESIKNAIVEVFNNQALQKNLIKEGEQQIKKFLWKKTADETVEVYKK